MIYSESGLLISLLVIGALCYVVLSIAEDCIDTINKDKSKNYESIGDIRTWDEDIKSGKNAWNDENFKNGNKNIRHGKNLKNNKNRKPVKIRRRKI